MARIMERPAKAGINYSLRLNSDIKTQSENLYRSRGMSLSTAIQVFLKKSLLVGGFPFEVRHSPPPIPDMAAMTGEDFDRELERGWTSMETGNVIDAKEARSRLMREIASWHSTSN